MKWYVAAAMALSLLFSASAELFYYVGNGGTDLRETDSYKLGSRDGGVPDRLPGAGDVIIFGSRYSTTTNHIEIAPGDIDFIASVAAISLRNACDLTVNVETNTHLPCAIGYFDETSPTWEWKGRYASVTYRVAPGVDLHLDSYRQIVASKAPIDYCTREMTVTGGGRVLLCDSLPESTDSGGFLGIITIDEGSSLVLGACFKSFNIDGLEGGGTFTTLRTTLDTSSVGVILVYNNNHRPHDFSGFLNLPRQIFRLNGGVVQNLLGPTNMLYNTTTLFFYNNSVLGFGVGNARRATPSSVGTNIVFYFKEGLTNTIRYAGTDPATAIWGKQIYFYNGESIIDAGHGPFQLGAANGNSDGYLWRSVRSTSNTTTRKGAARLVLTGEGLVTNTWRFGVYNKDGDLSDLPVSLVKKGTCTWKDIFKSPNNLTGVYAVDEGTLQFDTFAPAGTECSLGYGTVLYDPDYSSIAMPIDESKQVGYQLRIGGGESAGTLEYIGKTGVTNDSRVVAVNGAGTLKNSSGKTFKQYGIVTAGAGQHRLTLDGIAEAGDITNEVGALSVVKAGTGTTRLTRALKPNGMLEVEEGRLVVGSPRNYTYFKLIIKENMSYCFCADKGAGGYGGFEAIARFDELSFYDANGVRHGLNAQLSTAAELPDVGTNEFKVAVGGTSGSYGPLVNAFDGVFQSDTTGESSSTGIVSPRKGSSTGGGTMENPKSPSMENGYYRDISSSWTEFVVRLPLDTPEITSFDFVMMGGTNQSWHVATPRVFELQGSSDGITWYPLYTMDDLNAYFIANNLPFKDGGLWASTGIQTKNDPVTGARKYTGEAGSKGFGFVRRAYDESVQDFSQVTGVKVAPGAELVLDGFTAANAIDLIVVDSAAAGMGKLEHATLAAAGTLELREIPAEGSFDIPADLSGVVNPAALAGWQVKVGTQVKSRWSVRATATGIHVSKPGSMLTFR